MSERGDTTVSNQHGGAMTSPTVDQTPSSDLDRLPSRLSPSRAKDFLNCPQAFYFKTIRKLKTENTEATTRGTIAHKALEQLYGHPKAERTVNVAVSYVGPAWLEMRETSGYANVVERDSPAEQKMVAFAEKMVRNYFLIEDPTRYDPVDVEYHVEADINGVTLHGYIDRLDSVPLPNQGTDEAVFIQDFKTGKIPAPRFLDDAFFAMRIYALLYFKETGVIPYALRLIYLRGSEPGKAIKMVRVDQAMLERTERDVDRIWQQIKAAAAKGVWPTKTGPLCNFCDFKTICPAWSGKK